MSGQLAAQSNVIDILIPPDVIYCGFTRISPVPRAQYYEKPHSPPSAQEIVLTVSVIGPHRYNFTAAIHKQADVQTLARTVEALLAERRIIVACLIDLGSDNPLRWSDMIDDVLDGDSVVGVIPLSEATLVRTLHLTQSSSARPSNVRSTTTLSTVTTKSLSAPLPQLEFMHAGPARPQLTSRSGSSSSLGPPNFLTGDSTYLIDTALVRRRSDMQKPSIRALRILRPTSAQKRSSGLPAVEPFAKTYIPPLPSSPIPKAIQSPLSRICSNSISLLAFFRFCTRKKTLCELLYWLDTSTSLISEDYIHRTYMSLDAPLRLNIPREVSTTIEARELLRDGILAYSEKGFEHSPEGLRVQKLQSEREALFRQAAITLSGTAGNERRNFVDLLAKALDPEDTSILSLKERKSLDTRHAILAQVCAQYFPGKQVNTNTYFEYEEEHLTKPERLRRVNRRTAYAGLFDKRSSPRQVSQSSIPQITRPTASPLSRSGFGQPSRVSSYASAQIGEVMPMEDSSITGWTEVAGDGSRPEAETSISRVTSRAGRVRESDKSVAASSPGRVTSPNLSSVSHKRDSDSISSSGDATGSETAPASGSETRKADLVRRQQKLRNILGASPQDVLDKQGGSPRLVGDLSSFGVPRAASPTPSTVSRFTTASRGSIVSLSRAEKDEEEDRRSQIRRAAKLYAMFGEHADSSASIPSYRQNARSHKSQSLLSRPQSSASQYDLTPARSASRASFTSQRNHEPTTPVKSHDGRYLPDRNSGGRRTLRSFLTRNNSGSPMPPDLLSGFPTPPSATASPTSPAFRTHLTCSKFGGASLYGDDESIMEELGSDDEDDPEGDAIVADCRTNAKLRHLLGNDAPTSTIS